MNKRLLGIGLGLAMSMLTITSTFADNNTDILVNTAYEQLGKPYVWGSDIEDSASHDCSSLVAYCYRQLGISLPRCSYEQAYEGEEVAYDEIQAGDIICMRTSDRNYWANGVTHVGIAINNHEMIHAKGRNYGVVRQEIGDYSGRIVTIRRIINN